MHQTLELMVKISVLIFVVSSMLSMGAKLTVQEIIKPLGNTSLVIRSLIVSYILIPLTAIIIAKLLFLDEPLKIGLVLFSMAAGNEALPNIAHRVNGDRAFAVALMTLQVFLTMIYIPVMILLLLPNVNLAIGTLIFKLFLIIFFPLALGLLVKAWWGSAALKLHKISHLVSSVFAVLILIAVLVRGLEKFMSVFGSRAILAGMILLLIAALLGYFLGGPALGTRKVLSLGSCGRNVSLSLLVASQAFSDPKVIMMVITMSIVMMVAFVIALITLGRIGTRT